MTSKKCPICHSTNIVPSLQGYSPRSYAGNSYVPDISGISFYFCKSCFSGWRDDDNSLIQLYNFTNALHNKGFTRFINLLQGLPWDNFYKGIPDIITQTFEHLKRPIDVIEFGCPLNSVAYLSHPFTFNLHRLHRTQRKYKGLLSFFNFITDLPAYFSYLIYFYGRFKSLLKSFLGKSPQYPLYNSEWLNSITFFPSTFKYGWGTNCSIAGKSCFHVSSAFCHSREITMNHDDNTLRDIGFCLNFIDHSNHPVQFVLDCLSYSDILVFNVHKQNTAGPQHKYTLTEKFAEVLSVISHEKISCTVLDHPKISSSSMITFMATTTPVSPLFLHLSAAFSSK